jgi:hypothetical protein
LSRTGGAQADHRDRCVIGVFFRARYLFDVRFDFTAPF